jgi:hypothetical protein
MENNYKTKSVCIIDNGLFVELAITLSESFGKVYYYSPWESSFPRSNDMLVGYGVPGITRVNDFWSIIDDIDLFVFPDIYFGPLQLHLEKLGKRVWGSRKGEQLELQRDKTKQLFKSLKIPINKYEVIIGMDNLRKYLKLNDNKWIKINVTRGDFETFPSKNYKLIEPKLNEIEYLLGAKNSITKFIVEDAIDDAIEIGYDGYTIDGQFPRSAFYGIEVKDKGYLEKFTDASKMPKQISYVNERLSPVLKSYRYRNFFSSELRIKNKIPYFLDPCTRMGSPPGELYQIMIENLSDIIWNGANGKLIDPICSYTYGAELLIQSMWADKNWQAVQFPSGIRKNIKLRNLTIINKEYYVVPQLVGIPEIAAVVAVGDTIEEAIGKVKEYASQVEGYYIDTFTDSLDEGIKELAALSQQINIKF